MILQLHRSAFLRPRERLTELLLLQEADRSGGIASEGTAESVFDRRTVIGFLGDLEQRGLLRRNHEQGRKTYLLTATGRARLHYLVVDYVEELAQYHEEAQQIMRRSLVGLALAGVRRVAFYPSSETAQVASSVLGSLGLELVAVVDDSPRKWDTAFGHLRVRMPAELRRVHPEAVVVTTCLFQESIVAKIEAMQLDGVRIYTL